MRRLRACPGEQPTAEQVAGLEDVARALVVDVMDPAG